MMRFSLNYLAVILFTTWCLMATLALLVSAKPVPAEKSSDALVFGNLNSNATVRVDGYEFAYQTPDGVTRKESAILKNVGTNEEAISVQGSVTWLGPDGVQYTLEYLADENGFQPEGAHLPVAPETSV